MLKPVRGLQVAMLTAVVGGSIALAACGSSNDSSGGSGGASTVRLMDYANAAGAERLRSVLNGYPKVAPGVTVKLDSLPGSGAAVYPDKLRTELLGGKGPDAFRIWGGEIAKPFITSNQVADLGPYYAKYGWDKKIAKSAIDAMSLNGKKYGVPVLASSVGVFYSKAAFKKAGAKVPTTYAELEQVNDKLLKAGYVPVSTGGKFGWDPMRVFEYLLEHTAGPQLHDQLLARKTSWNRPEVVEAFTLFKRWVDKGWFNKGFLAVTPDDADTALLSKKAGMLFTGQWQETNIAAAKQDVADYGTFIPPTDQQPLRYSGFVEGYMIPVATKDKDRAAAVLNYIVSPGNPAKAGYQYTPVLSDKPDAKKFPLSAQWAEWQTKYTNYTIQDQAFPKELADAYFQIQSEVTQGKQTPQQAAANMQKAVQQTGGS